MKRYLLLICLFFSLSVGMNAQLISADSVKSLFHKMVESSSISQRLEIAKKAEAALVALLKSTSIAENILPPIEHLGRLEADNGLMVVYTWNVPAEEGGNHYFCVIQYQLSKKNKVMVVALLDSNDEVFNARRLRPDRWYGALYYAIIPTKTKGETNYVVLGWDGYNDVINRKIIDVISVSKKGNITLGAPVFELDRKFIYRRVFEYSSDLRMMLQYDIRRKEIVFDHLSPIEPRYEKFPQYYGPDFTYDGYTFKKKRWYLQRDIDLRNLAE